MGETTLRDYGGVGKNHYRNDSGRNDFEVMKVSRDQQNIYFYARTREAITPWRGGNWMMLLIDIDRESKTGWEGYDFLVNRTIEDDHTTWLEKNDGGWQWKKVAKLPCRAANRGRCRPAARGEGADLLEGERVEGLELEEARRGRRLARVARGDAGGDDAELRRHLLP